MLRRLAKSLLLWPLLVSAALAAGSGGINAPDQRGKPYLVLVSIDGFRWDYQGMTVTPALDRITANGVRVERVVPVFPTLTFPNHYSIATGLYPVHHGIIGNYFPDASNKRWYALNRREAVQDGAWYRGEPVWVAAEKHGMVTAAYFFVGTEAAIDGVPMTYWNAYDEQVPGEVRVDQALAWLALPDDKRPHFIALYFEHVDEATHAHAPGSPESIAAIRQVDGYLGRLLDGIDRSAVADRTYVVVVSDHGQRAVDTREPPFILDSVANLDGISVVDHGAAAFVYIPGDDPARAARICDAVNAAWPHGRAWLRRDLPAAWHVDDDPAFADVVLQAEPGYRVFSTASRVNLKPLGNHGWAPETPEMQAIFMASGPRLPKGLEIGAISTVDIYPLLMKILDLPVSTPIDGDPDVLVPLLR